MAKIFLADSMAPAEGRTLELARAYLCNVVGQSTAHDLMQFYFLQHLVDAQEVFRSPKHNALHIYFPFSSKALRIFSGVMGSSMKSTPMAS